MSGGTGPLWLVIEDIMELHTLMIARFGGKEGVRDIRLVESALARPEQLSHYEGEADLLTLAVRLGVGLARNHGFIDGNKRVGAGAMIEFLAINGYALDMPNDTTFGVLFEAAVTGNITEGQLIEDLYPYVTPLE